MQQGGEATKNSTRQGQGLELGIIDEDFFNPELIGAEAAREMRVRFQQYFPQDAQQPGEEADEHQQQGPHHQQRPVFINSLTVDRKPGEGYPPGYEEEEVAGRGMQFGESAQMRQQFNRLGLGDAEGGGGNYFRQSRGGGAYNYPLLAQSSSGNMMRRDVEAAEENASLQAENQLLYGEIHQLGQEIGKCRETTLQLEARLAVLKMRKEMLTGGAHKKAEKRETGGDDEEEEKQVQMETTDE